MNPPQQEDYQPHYQPTKPYAIGAVDPGHFEEGTHIEPTYDLPRPSQVQSAQEPVIVEKRLAPGLQAFNVNQLIEKGLFEAAEYFLGRPLTDAERAHGMMSKTEYEEYMRHKAKAAHASTMDDEVKLTNKLLKELLKATKRSKKRKDDEDEDEDEEEEDDEDGDLVTVPTRARLGIRLDEFGGDQKDDDEPENNIDPITKQRLIATYGQEAYDNLASTAREDWTPEQIRQYADVLPGGSPDDDETEIRTVKRVDVPQKKADLAEIVPDFSADRVYTVAEAKALLGEWRIKYPGIKNTIGKNSYLFSAYPKSQTKDTLTAKVRNAYQEVQNYELEVARQAEQPEEEEEPRRLRVRGSGVTVTKWVPFGPKWFISPARLNEDDTLSIVKGDKMKVNQHPNRTVSAAMKVCLNAWLEGKPMPTELLSEKEKEFLEWLFHDAKIVMKKKPVSKLEVKRTPAQTKERLAVLMGEIAEGPNDNPLLKKEFVSVFNQACLRGILSESQLQTGRDFIKTFG